MISVFAPDHVSELWHLWPQILCACPKNLEKIWWPKLPLLQMFLALSLLLSKWTSLILCDLGPLKRCSLIFVMVPMTPRIGSLQCLFYLFLASRTSEQSSRQLAQLPDSYCTARNWRQLVGAEKWRIECLYVSLTERLFRTYQRDICSYFAWWKVGVSVRECCNERACLPFVKRGWIDTLTLFKEHVHQTLKRCWSGPWRRTRLELIQ